MIRNVESQRRDNVVSARIKEKLLKGLLVLAKSYKNLIGDNFLGQFVKIFNNLPFVGFACRSVIFQPDTSKKELLGWE